MVGEIRSEALEGGSGGEGVARAVHYLDAVAFQHGDEQVCELLRGFETEVFLVVPLGLVRVELGAGFLHFVQREGLHQLRQGEHFAVVSGVPAQHGQQVHEGLGEVTVLPVAVGHFTGLGVLPGQREHGEAQFVTVPLGEFSVADGLQKKRQVGEAGHGVLPAEGLVQQIVQRQGRQPLLSADHLRDFHQVVVHYVGEVVGGELIGPFPQHLVVQGVRIHFHVAADEVFHLHDAVVGHLEADGPVRGGFQQALHLLLREGEGVAKFLPGGGVVHKGLSGGLGGGAALVKLFGAVESVIGPAVCHKLLGILPIDGPSLALAVGSVGVFLIGHLHYFAVFVHALVGNDSAPAEGFDDILFRSRHKTVGVCILYPDDEISSFLLGVQVVIQSRTHAAHMQRPGRRRGKSYTCSSFHHFKIEGAKIVLF